MRKKVHWFVVLCVCWDTPCEDGPAGLWRLPKYIASNSFSRRTREEATTWRGDCTKVRGPASPSSDDRVEGVSIEFAAEIMGRHDCAFRVYSGHLLDAI